MVFGRGAAVIFADSIVSVRSGVVACILSFPPTPGDVSGQETPSVICRCQAYTLAASLLRAVVHPTGPRAVAAGNSYGRARAARSAQTKNTVAFEWSVVVLMKESQRKVVEHSFFESTR